MDKSREGARHLTIASAIIATIMILATKTSTVNYLAYYVGHEYFKATCIFSSLVVIETTIIMLIVVAALGDIVATQRNEATEERNISDYVWMASICARPYAICVAISSAHVLPSSTIMHLETLKRIVKWRSTSGRVMFQNYLHTLARQNVHY